MTLHILGLVNMPKIIYIHKGTSHSMQTLALAPQTRTKAAVTANCEVEIVQL